MGFRGSRVQIPPSRLRESLHDTYVTGLHPPAREPLRHLLRQVCHPLTRHRRMFHYEYCRVPLEGIDVSPENRPAWNRRVPIGRPARRT
jgi:hypothetical protein